MFAFQWREFSPPLSSAHRLLPYTKERQETLQFPPPTMAISQWARSLEFRHADTLHIAVGMNCTTFFPFSCEACSLYLVLGLCGQHRRVICPSLNYYTTHHEIQCWALPNTHTLVPPCKTIRLINLRTPAAGE